ncbi:hypothetical protein MIND_00867900 [Mycena indigotica]|uniref:PH domain-containing protein n=1 Tax=Mycena indigotica TaxID=2126181 RepID=A0A8H6VZ74_9AGAR|nr:uncharacterized protein MIND_00867900 [Mycena indigotica]KAF7299192.1 hypothetical protein MIND_00867900 [Mycena indigotica]
MIPTIVEPPATLTRFPSATTQHSVSRSFNLEHGHPLQKRMFVGPILEKQLEAVTGQSKGKKRLLARLGSVDDGDATISEFVKDHAFAFFLQEGGQEEDWENNEEGIREEMLRRWRESEWGLLRRRKEKTDWKQPKWIGGSFEVGNILGVNVLHDQAESIRTSNRSTRFGASSSHLPFSLDEHATSITHAPSSFVTAPQQGAPSSSNLHVPSLLPNGGDEELRRTQSDFATPPRPSLQPSSPVVKSDSEIPVVAKRTVHYAQLPDRDASSSGTPASPSEVLERNPAEIPDTSAAATIESPSPAPLAHWEDFTIRDRMLVRVGYTKSESLGPAFDEEASRTTRGVRYEEWAEFIVQWHNNIIHFYEPHNIPGTKWFSGTKYRLAYIVPLKSSNVKLSLYSFTDLTFSLTCPPATFRSRNKKTRSRALFRRVKEGTNIFICKVKSRSRAADWMWSSTLNMCVVSKPSHRRRLGGVLPPTIDVRNPALDLHVKIETPEPRLPGQDAPEMFSLTNIMRLCMRELRRVKDWEELIERQLALGKTLMLAWRAGTQLDWVCDEFDVRGDPRSSAVLYGLSMQQSRPFPQLELRLAQHVPQFTSLKNGTRISEPPSIEGYLERIRPNTQTKVLVYLVSHEGCLFSVPSNNANPPSPLGIDPGVQNAESLRSSEVKRGTQQIMDATGVVDVRSIIAVRRAFQPVLPSTHDVKPHNEEEGFVALGTPVERSLSDDEDEGGEEVLRSAADKPNLKMRRSFELLLKNGHVIRFEAHSRKVAIEWVERLRALMAYWKQRHRMDAAEEMDLAQAYRPRLTPRRHIMHNDSQLPPEAPIDITAPLPTLSNLYTLCSLEACKPVARSGRLFMREGFYGQYKYVHLFLLPGHLVQFHIESQSSLHLAMHKQINLADAYVCSGFLAALSLPNGQYNANSPPLPRRYQDGLETDDSDEATLFMIWYHPHKSEVPRPPPLAAKRKAVMFRCRNRLERDTWCWALGCEIEKLAKSRREREEDARNIGGEFS